MADDVKAEDVEAVSAALRYHVTQFGPADKWVTVEKIEDGFRVVTVHHDGRRAAAKECARLNAEATIRTLLSRGWTPPGGK